MKIRLKVNSIDMIFALLVFFVCAANGSVGRTFQQILSICLIFGVLLKSRKAIIPNELIALDILLIGFIIIQVLLGIAVNSTATMVAFRSVVTTTLCCYAFCSYFKYVKDMTKAIYTYVICSIIALLLLGVLNIQSLSQFRFDATDVTFYLWGGHSSTMLAYIAALPSIFVAIYIVPRNKAFGVSLIAVFTIICVATGTRKTLLLIFYAIIASVAIRKKNINLSSFFKILFTAMIALLLGYFAVMKIPFLYDFIGNRIASAFAFSTYGDDASLRVRVLFVDQAMELFSQHRICGWGMNYFSTISYNNYYTHNNYLELLSGGGVVAFTLFYLKYFAVLKKIIINKVVSKSEKCVWFGFLGVLLILEYWQVTYIYQTIMIVLVLVNAILDKSVYRKF